MKEVRNISAKVIGIPNVEGGNTPLLPDQTIVIDDKTSENEGVQFLADQNYIVIKTIATKKVAPVVEEPVVEEVEEAPEIVENVAETEEKPAKAKTAPRSRKK